jgi:hypothetical protein
LTYIFSFLLKLLVPVMFNSKVYVSWQILPSVFVLWNLSWPLLVSDHHHANWKIYWGSMWSLLAICTMMYVFRIFCWISTSSWSSHWLQLLIICLFPAPWYRTSPRIFSIHVYFTRQILRTSLLDDEH